MESGFPRFVSEKKIFCVSCSHMLVLVMHDLTIVMKSPCPIQDFLLVERCHQYMSNLHVVQSFERYMHLDDCCTFSGV